jgi:Ca2+/Na+ antiporter
VKSQALVLALTSIIPLLTVLFGFTYSLSFLGVTVYLAFLVHTLLQSRKTQHPHTPHDLEQASGHVEGKIKESSLDSDEDGEDSDEEEDDDNTPTWKGFGYLALGGSLIFIFSEPFINAVSALATMMDVNSTLLAFFLAPIASEMPEILESISLSRKGNPTNINIAFSNLVGGTITKTTLLMGIFSMYGLSMPLVYESPSFSISLVLMIICSIACGCIGYLGYRLSKQHAYLLFGLFIITCIVQYMANSQFGQSLMPLSSSPN